MDFRILTDKLAGLNPRIAALAAIPVLAFVATIAFSLASESDPEPRSNAQVAISTQTLPTPLPTSAAPTATVTSDRTNCDQIRGTAYRSDAERTWYIANCSGTTASAGTGTGGGATGGGTTAAPAGRSAVEVGTGDRLIITKIGVNASVSRTSVGGDGVMPDPVGYFNAVVYDFPSHPGLGGSFTSGNLVMAGHVDCGRCGPGGTPSLGVFYYARNLVAGDTIEYYTNAGGYQRYVVTFAGDYQPNTDWSSIVASGAANLTIITCTGTFSGGEYNLRRVVQAVKA